VNKPRQNCEQIFTENLTDQLRSLVVVLVLDLSDFGAEKRILRQLFCSII